MQLTKGTILLLTLCLSCSDIWASPRIGVINDIWTSLGDATDGIIEGIAQATKDGAELTSDILEDLDNAKLNSLNSIHQIADIITNAISDALTENLANLTTNLQSSLKDLEAVVSDEKNAIKSAALKKGQDALKGLDASAAQLKEELANIEDKLSDTIDKQVTDAIESLQTWGEEQLQRVNKSTNGAGVRQARDLIQNVIERFTYGLQQSLDQLAYLQSQFELDVNDAIQTYAVLARQLIDRMNRCNVSSALRCQDNILGLVAKLNNAPGQLKNLIRKGEQLVNSGIYATQRIDRLVTQIAQAQLQCEINLDIIIKYNKDIEGDETTEDNATDEATEDADSTTQEDDDDGTSSNGEDGI